MDVRTLIQTKPLLFDGAMGTMLQKAGLSPGGLPEMYNIQKPEVVTDIHRQYLAAGSDIITANTFQANAHKIKGSGQTPAALITAGVTLARRAGARFVALDLGPIGQLLEPMGTLSFAEAYALYREQILAGVRAGADLILFETMSDLLEVKAGVLAAKEACDLPIVVTMSYQEDGRTFVGCDPASAAVTLTALRVDALGVNCSLGPKELAPVVDTLLAYAGVPVLVQPNAGLPKLKDGRTVYDISEEAYAACMKSFAEKGVRLFGGCCGTTPAYIAALRTAVDGTEIPPPPAKRRSVVCSGVRAVCLDDGACVIGERINPTGKKLLKEKLRAGDFDYVVSEALRQAQAGADILDVNCGLPEIDEAAALTRAVREVQAVTNLPLQLDSADPAALEAALRIYNGKPIINSVNGKRESMEAIFPLAAKYGAAVVGLCLDESGIPETAEGRLTVAEKIVRTAADYGIDAADILIDCLVLTASAQQALVQETLKALRLVKASLGVKTVLGVSNVSFGLPQRPLLNSVFLAAGFGAGLDAAIVNPLSAEIMRTVDAFRVLNNRDTDAAVYIARYSGEQAEPLPAVSEAADLKELIVSGRKEETARQTAALLRTQEPLSVIDTHFIPALDIVGARYEQGAIFLPQLIQSAEAVKAGFSVIREAVPASESAEKGTILLATVEGDIHDIGKNIAKLLLENYGYRVIDLGKDVPVQTVVDAALRHDIRLIGLSALMTTTVKSMKETIAALRAAGSRAKVMVGGAVLNEEYVSFVGADYYVKDARADVTVAQAVFGG